MACMGVYAADETYRCNTKQYCNADENFFKKLTKLRKKVNNYNPLINVLPELEQFIAEYKTEYKAFQTANIKKRIADCKAELQRLEQQLAVL